MVWGLTVIRGSRDRQNGKRVSVVKQHLYKCVSKSTVDKSTVDKSMVEVADPGHAI